MSDLASPSVAAVTRSGADPSPGYAHTCTASTPDPSVAAPSIAHPATVKVPATVPGAGVSIAIIGVGTASAPIAASTCSRGNQPPLPGRASSSFTPADRSDDKISSTVAPGLRCLRIAHAPAACGAAIDVPDM